ncbi:cytochrome c oxidase subunit 7A2, mitochondrial-like [Brachyistius frenatus]|uniref:cytochrome c oxidase subunit 7A2, mitochondrial-like n=1 Tax=Brachyistius frenatus TaxID=100188 RepID=UPI0037E83D69
MSHCNTDVWPADVTIVTGVWQLCRRTVCSSARRRIDDTVKQKQKLFQELLISFKTNTARITFIQGRAALHTMTLTVFGTGYVVYELFSAAMPKKP